MSAFGILTPAGFPTSPAEVSDERLFAIWGCRLFSSLLAPTRWFHGRLVVLMGALNHRGIIRAPVAALIVPAKSTNPGSISVVVRYLGDCPTLRLGSSCE